MNLEKINNLRGKIPENKSGGIKDDSGKLLYTLLPPKALKEVTKILMIGAKKYDKNNWRKVERERYVEALYRHFMLFLEGEAIDPESGLSHLAHLACNALFLIELYKDEAFITS